MNAADLSPASEHRTIAIVGAGAAGLATAIFAAEEIDNAGLPISIALLEGAPRIGAKILVSGGGRCNVTHFAVSSDDYHGKRNVVRNVLRAFDAANQNLPLFSGRIWATVNKCLPVSCIPRFCL